jgi:hypothetical protein
VIRGAIALARGSPIAGGHSVSPIWTGLGHIKSAFLVASWYFESHYKVVCMSSLLGQYYPTFLFLTAHGVAKSGGVGEGPLEESSEPALVGMQDEMTQDGWHYGVDFCVDGLRIVSYMIGSHCYHSQCWTVLACYSS